MTPSKRTITLKVDGPKRVPVSVVAEKLQAAQRLLLNIGSALRGGGRRGAFKAEILEGCELVFVESRPGSLEVVAELSHPVLFPEEGVEIGNQAIDKMSETLPVVSQGDRKGMERLYPDHGQRMRVLNATLALLPGREDEYDIVVTTDSASVRFSPLDRPRVIAMSRAEEEPAPSQEVRTLTGKLYLIEVETGQRQLGLIVENRQVPCYYTPEYEDLVRQLVPGSLVEVEGIATIGDEDRVARIEEILEARAVDIAPIHWSRLSYQNRRFMLKQSLHVDVQFRDGVWVHECEPLGILAYGQTRTESVEAFRQDFAACYDVIALEADENLTDDARELKVRINDMVQKVEEIA